MIDFLNDIMHVPFTMRPNFEKYNGEDVWPEEFYVASEREYKKQLREQMFRQKGQYIWFETDIAKEQKIVKLAANTLGYDVMNIADLGMKLKEDIMIMHKGRLEACFAPFASGWNPADKKGMTLAELHDPVADNEALQNASDAIIKTLSARKNNMYHRFTWAISTLPTYSNHPIYLRPEAKSLDDLWLRVEHETTLCLKTKETILFLVDIKIIPLKTCLNSNLLESIASMSDAVKEYKNITSEIIDYIL